MTTNIFEKATRNKFRFNFRGLISVEDLWDLSVTQLDSIFKTLNAVKKTQSEDSLLDTPTKADTVVNAKIKIIKYIVAIKQAEAEVRKTASDRAAQRQKLMAILADKQDEETKSKSAAEVEAMIKELGDE
jgi:hypothetical protein